MQADDEAQMYLAHLMGMSALLLSGHTLLGPISVVGAAFWIFTGFVGWCPACALIGRKIKRNQPAQPQPTQSST